jgi:hypothetical protein
MSHEVDIAKQALKLTLGGFTVGVPEGVPGVVPEERWNAGTGGTPKRWFCVLRSSSTGTPTGTISGTPTVNPPILDLHMYVPTT